MLLGEPTYLTLLRRLRSSRLFGVLSIGGIALLCGCREPEPQASPEIAIVPSAVGTDGGSGAEAGSALAPTPERAFEEASALIREVMAKPDLGGAPGLEKQRASMVARAKSEPVVFVRAPEPAEAAAGVQSLRTNFESTDYPWRELKDLRQRFSKRPEVMRELLLREGYLYTEEPNRAFTLVSQVKPKHLFDEERLWVHRGPWLMHAERGEEGDYFFLDGPEQGKKVRLLHLDRVGTGEVPEPLHRDFRGLRYRIHFERAKIRHLDERNIVADLRYGTHWVPTLLESNGARLDVVAEAIPPEDAEAIRETRKLLERKARAVSVLRTAMRQQIDEGLPFDEPKTEEGQQDGALRRQWRGAYLANRDYYRFNEDRYPVFDDAGKPRVPQVCVDFMVDTFERASGTWWRGKDDPVRERTIGKLNLVEFAENDQLRRTKGFLAFAREHDQWFDVLTFPKYMRVELGYKPTFFAWLEKKADHFEPGDIVFIRGMTPWDEIDEHSHSFFIFETDPVSGVPIAIAGNAGPANLWSWETEARRTPNRSVRDRIRPKLEWLETFITVDPSLELEPPALVSGKK